MSTLPTPNLSPQVFQETPHRRRLARDEAHSHSNASPAHNTMPRSLFTPCLALLLVFLLPYHVEGRACQVRNYAGRPVNFYWMDVTNWGNYISQTKVPLPHATSSPLKTYETHRFFAAFADEAAEVPSWDPDSIPLNAQFVHRGFDQVVTALLNEEGQLYLDDWDIHEGEMTRLAQAISTCNQTTSTSEDEHAACVLAQAGVLVQSLERERDDIEALVSRMETRLDGAFCTGTGRFQTSAKRTFEWEGHQVDVLAETDNLVVFHFPAFLDASATETLLLSAPGNGTRHVDTKPNPKLSFDASLAVRQDWAQGFVNAQLGGGEREGGREGGGRRGLAHLQVQQKGIPLPSLRWSLSRPAVASERVRSYPPPVPAPSQPESQRHGSVAIHDRGGRDPGRVHFSRRRCCAFPL